MYLSDGESPRAAPAAMEMISPGTPLCAPGERAYLPSCSLRDYIALMERRHPSAASLLTFDRPGTDEVLWALAAGRNEFETDAGGRGESYRRAQADAEVRSPGILRLLELVAGGTQVGDLPSGFTVLDVLGGDGVVARLVHRRSSKACHVLTGDIASEMVHRAIGYGLPAVRQPAHFLFVRDRSLDGVLIAYGFHHLTAGERPAACGEAHRVLRPGGRIVLHDFENGSPVATWFQEVVDRYTETGHQYEHFTRDSLRRLLLEAGFQAVILDSVYDPFVVRGRSETERSIVSWTTCSTCTAFELAWNGPARARRSELASGNSWTPSSGTRTAPRGCPRDRAGCASTRTSAGGLPSCPESRLPPRAARTATERCAESPQSSEPPPRSPAAYTSSA